MANDKLTSISHAETIEWARQALKQPKLSSSVVVETPWSSVLKIDLSHGPVYLKQTPPDLFIEVEIIKKCRDLCQITNIPEVISADRTLHCFLMKKCGDESLRTLFNGDLSIDLLIQGLWVYKNILQATAPHINEFLEIGVPDWRLNQFPKLYHDLVSDKAFLESNGLSEDQIIILANSVRAVEDLSQELSRYGIPECLNHSDFHENNMLFDHSTNKITIIDLSEAAINHPFFSLAAFLKIPCNRYGMVHRSADYIKLHDVCFSGWLSSDEDLQKALALTEKLLPIYLTFAQMRLVNATCPIALGNITRMKHRVRDGFLWFLKNLET